MKPIKLTAENFAAINATLDSVNGRAAAHTYSTASEIETEYNSAVKSISNTLPKAMLKGVKTVITSGSKITASSYKGQVIRNKVTIEIRASGAFITDIDKFSAFPNQSVAPKITISPEQRDEIAKRAVSGYYVKTQA